MRKKLTILSIITLVLLWIFTASGCKFDQTVTNFVEKMTAKFMTSGHADDTAEAFRHWDEDDPPEVPTRCAKCHSAGGFIDFAADGTVDAAAEPGAFTCDVCHTDSENGTLRQFASVTFPSGATIATEGAEGICMQCHQGRASAASVDGDIADAGVGDDTVSGDLGFSNIHYFAAGATMYGTLVKGGYQYAGKSYDAQFTHVKDYTACNACHDPHTLKIRAERCDTCHTMVKSEADVHDIRFYGSLTDYDGDGNITEGIYYEVQGIIPKLYAAIQMYAKKVVGTPIGYEAHTHPYFFNDSNGNGTIEESEAVRANAYSSWTPRLLRAAYNYQVVLKDPGGFAHGGKYLIQLMYDSIENLNAGMPGGISMAGMHRGDEGHFDGSAEAWRHWDGDGEVRSSCARCHSATGLATYLETGENEEAAHLSNGMLCTTCHTSPPSLYRADSIEFPSGAVLDTGDNSNICMACHQGRASKKTIDNAIASGSAPYRFSNIHYFPAAAVFFGTDAKGGYEFAGKSYAGRKMFTNHEGRFDTCIKCHMGTMGDDYEAGHNVHKVNKADCVNCHGQDPGQPYPGADPAKFMFTGIRPGSTPDYDGDGNMDESVYSEIKGLEAALYAQIQAYGFAIGSPIAYDAHSYPYFFSDSNGNGKVDPGEESYGDFNAKLLKAAYNYQLSIKEPNGFIHNSRYIAQLLVDSIQNLGGSIAPYKWR